MTSIIDIPPTADMYIYRNDTEVKTVRKKDRNTRQLEDLTGATALMQLRATPNSATILYTFTTTIANNEITITIPQADWTTIQTLMESPTTEIEIMEIKGKQYTFYKIGFYDLQVTYPGGVNKTFIQGTYSIQEDTSR